MSIVAPAFNPLGSLNLLSCAFRKSHPYSAAQCSAAIVETCDRQDGKNRRDSKGKTDSDKKKKGRRYSEGPTTAAQERTGKGQGKKAEQFSVAIRDKETLRNESNPRGRQTPNPKPEPCLGHLISLSLPWNAVKPSNHKHLAGQSRFDQRCLCRCRVSCIASSLPCSLLALHPIISPSSESLQSPASCSIQEYARIVLKGRRIRREKIEKAEKKRKRRRGKEADRDSIETETRRRLGKQIFLHHRLVWSPLLLLDCRRRNETTTPF